MKSIETTTKVSLIFRNCRFCGEKERKANGIFLDFFFINLDGRQEIVFEIVLNAVSIEVPVNFYKLKFRPLNFIHLKRLSRRASLDV